MASPPFFVEGQTAEGFVGKLVDDRVDIAASEPSSTENLGNDNAQVCAKLSINEVGTPSDGLVGSAQSIEDDLGEQDNKDGVNLCENKDKVDNMGVEDGSGIAESSYFVDTKSVPEYCDHLVGSERVSDSAACNGSANVSGGIKEVQWSAFGGGKREGSYSDFFSEFGDNSADLFGELASGVAVASDTLSGVSANQAPCSVSYNSLQNEANLQHGSFSDDYTLIQEQNTSQYWEDLYPGWKYDPYTGQWYQVDGSDAVVSNGENYDASSQSVSAGADADPKSDEYYLQQTAQSAVGSFSEESKTGTVSYWNQNTQGSTEYPSHMVFDPQYPGWYYDTIAQEWKSLESYFSSMDQLDQNQQMSNGNFAAGQYYSGLNMGYRQDEKVYKFSHHQDQQMNWRGSGNNNHQHDMNMVQPEPFGKIATAGSTQHTYFGNGFIPSGQMNYTAGFRADVASPRGFESSTGSNGFQSYSNNVPGYQSFASAEKISQPDNQQSMAFDQQLNFSQQPFQNKGQSLYGSNKSRTSAGRPPHPLVAFGFGGKLIVMKKQTTLHTQSPFVSQDAAECIISVLNMMEVALPKSDGVNVGFGYCDYFRSLSQHLFPSPLVSGHVGSKELNKWIDDRIANCSMPDVDYKKGEALKMLFSLLKIACQYYGKLHSSGADIGLKEHDDPESAVAKLFASAKQPSLYLNATSHSLLNLPSDEQLQATACEVQMLLVAGKRMEALQCAQEGCLWGPAIIIATLLGDQFYGETVKQMALHQFAAGSPLRTLCLLLAGQPAEVFSNLSTTNPLSGVDTSQTLQAGPNCMLDEWEENLAILTANRTSGDELVITHLGDCLWKERGEVIAAHICYLIAEANIDFYSESARLCLIGADHLKNPRTYASPLAIQRTELYEYAKVLGNSQFILLPFQPYKIIYASMLAEIGKLSDSLKYCEAAAKSLKAGRSSEVDAWRQAAWSLEDRIRLYLQGGYATNLAPAKLVGKLLNFFDNTAHRVVGGPPPITSPSPSNGKHTETDHQSSEAIVSTSQSTVATSSLLPSASTEEITLNSLHNQSVSELDVGRKPRKVESPEKSNSSAPDSTTASTSSGQSRISRIGSQIFQKTFGLILRSRPDRQAKLGDENKFYFDEKLKCWVERGAEPPAEEPALVPPPKTVAFMNGKPDHEKKGEFVNGPVHANREPEVKSSHFVENGAGTLPIPSDSNRFSAQGRMGVRSRYVDTFNKGGGYQANMFKSPSPSVPATNPITSNAKFFIPKSITGGQQTHTCSNPQETVTEDTTTSDENQSFSSPRMSTSQSTILRPRSMEFAPRSEMGTLNGNGLHHSHSRRALSWSGGLEESPSHKSTNSEARTQGEALSSPPSRG